MMRRARGMARQGVLMLLLLACSDETGGDGASWRAERGQRGDTIVVRTVSGSIWGDSVRLEEELRIGALEGDERYLFANIGAIAVGTNGTIFVLDRRPASIRQYDANGQWLRTIARAGGGPGELRLPTGMTTLSDGRLIVPDAENDRTNVFSSTGEHVGDWRVNPRMVTARSVVADSTDHTYFKISMGSSRPGAMDAKVGLLRVSPQGEILDTIAPPPWPGDLGRQDYRPRGRSEWHPGGYWVTGWTDDYAFELRRTPVMRVERAWTPISITAAERADLGPALEKLNETMAKVGYPVGPTDVPETKPAYRSLMVARDGRVWVTPHVESVKGEPSRVVGASGWTEPTVYDVFDADGRYMGRVTPPEKATFHVMDGDLVWGVQRGADDEPYVVRWRIIVGGR